MMNSAEEFLSLRNSENPEDSFRALHDGAPVTVWHDVISRFPEMREWVVHNKTVPLEILEVLVSDGEASVRATIADKRKLNREIFQTLLKDPEELVRQRLAYNKKIPLDLLEQLASDPSPLVRTVVLKRLGKVGSGE